MSKNLINRYIWLVDTIYQAGLTGITLREISDKWEKNRLMSDGEEYPPAHLHAPQEGHLGHLRH